ncbi:MAG: hypothetical protein ACO3HA_10855 [Burkholderiales bacterium]
MIALLCVTGIMLPLDRKAAAQTPANLPMVEQVPAAAPQAVDGTWIINTIQKKIRIEGGRAWALEPWVHAMLWAIQPDMVVIRNLAQVSPGTYTGDDLPLAGKLTAKLQSDRTIAVTVPTILGVLSYKLLPVELDNAAAYDEEIRVIAAAPAPAPDPEPAPVAARGPASGGAAGGAQARKNRQPDRRRPLRRQQPAALHFPVGETGQPQCLSRRQLLRQAQWRRMLVLPQR